MFVMRINSISYDAAYKHTAEIQKLGRHTGESPAARSLHRNELVRSDLPLLFIQNSFTMRTKKSNEWAVSEVKINYKPARHPQKITDSQSSYRIFQQIWDQELLHIQEQFYVLFLNQAGDVLCWRLIGTGTGKSVLVDKKLMATIVCKTFAHNVVLAHNHPSGNLKPSKADRQLTWGLEKLMDLFDVKVIDHLIISGNGYYSFADSGLIYNPKHD